jgi:nucleotide-binding universal stress UspA family protein
MSDIRRILCPIDFSDPSQHALDHAVMMAGWYGARITALHVRHPAFLVEPPILVADFATAPDGLQEVESRLHHWLAPARAAGIACDVMAVDASNAAACIVDVASRVEADLIVLGTHGRSGFERLLLGSVTERVVRTSRVPVITVPPPAVATHALPFTHVLCGIDFSSPSVEALQFALSVVRQSGAALTLVHVLEFPFEGETFDASFDAEVYHTAVAADAARRLDALITDEVRQWCQPAVRMVRGRAHEELVAVAAEVRADLIVLGVHGRNAVDLMLFGSTTNQVIRRSTCPVLTLCR